MTLIVLLDSGPLGLVTNPSSARARPCNEWLENLLLSGAVARVPEIADYEVRRELIRAAKTPGIHRLDRLALTLGYVPLTTIAMRKAAEFWADARRRGKPTAAQPALDADAILSAQAATLDLSQGDRVLIATTNVGHLSQFVEAARWEDIRTI